MKQHYTLKSLLVIMFLLFGLKLQAEVSKQINVVTAGTLPSLISSEEKDQITSLTITGDLNGTDICFIREMAGRDKYGNITSGNLSILDISGANIVEGGNNYFSDYSSSDNIIGDCMFQHTYLTSIILPNSVISIGNSAFVDCVKLNSVTIPNSVKSIGDWAFGNCSGLTSITIPKRVALIGEGAFIDCSGLYEILVSEDNYLYSSVDGVLFNKNKSILITYPNLRSKSYSIPTSVTSICDYAFRGCGELISVSIPASVTSIGDDAFLNCTVLMSITIGNGVRAIGDDAFNNCTGLTSITIPDSVYSIGDWAFAYCSGLTSVTIPNSITSIGRSTFMGCSGLTSIDIPDNVKSININAFSNCSGLTSVKIPNSVKSIGKYAFYNCTELASVIIGNSVSTIDESVFYSCIGLREIHNNNTTPQTLNASVFEGVDKSICTLYVPKGSFSNYLFASIWGDFENIIEEDITSNNQIRSDIIKVYTESESIVIEGVEFGEDISIYTESGALVQKTKVTEDIVKINVPIDNVYLVKIAHRTFKVAL